jgi:hypothetical protein
MKKSIALLLFIVTSTIYAQNSGITYQAVIYNPSIEILPGNNNPNVVLANKEICLRFSIKDAASSLEYQEVQKVKTDEFGMVNLVVGQGNQISGYVANFGAIVWNSSNKTLAVAIDTNANCSNFIEVSEQFFSAVPFAYASKVAETVSGIVPIVNGGTGAATVAGAKTNLGLNNVDNTSDLNKPVSTATQTALDAKAPLASPGFTGVPTAPTAPTGTSTTQIATTAFVNAALATAAAPDATTTLKGRIQLAGDLSGTADAPTVPALANKENLANKSTDMVADANSTTKYPSVKLIKDYVDSLTSSGVADADSTTKGKIQLAGDLAGTSSSAANPIISNDAISTVKIADGAVTTSKINDVSVTETKLAANAVTTNKIVDGTIAAIDLATNSVTTDKITDASVTETKLATNAITTAKMIDGAVTTPKIADNAVTNAKIGGVVAVNKGGTGSDMSNAGAGYVKQATSGAVFTTVSTIPVADVTGAVRKVNGVVPDANGNVAVIIGRVFTGATVDPNLATSIISASPAKQQSDIYIVADGNNPNNGRTFIYDGTNWLEVATDLSATDARYVNVAGDTMEGNLTIPTGKKIIITDLPSNATDATNKEYVDTKIGGSGTTNFVPKFSAAKTLTDSSIFDNGTNVGIGTASPANKLEITQGTEGNSGLRFTNLTASSAATTASSKVLGLNSNGDVILTNVPGTQNIVAFSTANPNSGSPTFTPAQPTDQSVVYQSSVDNSMWTYNGTTYVTYIPPASTAWNLANTTNDAGSNKTSGIFRTGNVAIGTNNPTGNFEVNGSSTQTMVNILNSNTSGRVLTKFKAASGGDFDFRVYSNGYSETLFGQSMSGKATWMGFSDLLLGTLTTNPMIFGTNGIERMRILSDGRIGLGTTSPSTTLHINNTLLATNSVNADAQVLRLSRPQTTNQKWDNIAQFNLGSYSNSTVSATSRLDLALSDGAGTTTSNVMTWQANGYVGIGTTAPVSSFSNTSTAIQGSNTTNAFNGGLAWSSPGTGFAGSFYSQPSNGNGLQIKIAGNTSSNNALEVSSGATQTGSLTPLFNVLGNGNVGVGTLTPITRLIVNDNTYIANIPTTTANLMDNSTFRPLTRFQATSGINNNAISHYLTTTVAATQAHNYSIGTTLPYVLQPAGGNVGIGTTNPRNNLDVVGGFNLRNVVGNNGSNFGMEFNTNSNSPRIDWVSNGAYAGSLAGDSDTFLRIHNSSAGTGGFRFTTTPSGVTGVERMTILNNGNIGVGTTAPAAQLHTTGSVRFAGAGTPAANRVLTSDASGNATWQPVNFAPAVQNRTIDFSLTAADSGSVIVVNSTNTVTITIPSTLSAGFYCQIIQQGAGQVNVVGSGVSVTSALGTFSRTTGSSIGIMLTSTTAAFLSGDTAF